MYVGKVTERFDAGAADAAFINLDEYPSSGFSQSTILSGSYNIIGASPVGIVGTVYEAHLGLSGMYYATVYSTSITYWDVYLIPHTDIIDMTQSYSQNGDSGSSLVFAPTNVGTFRYIVGTLIGTTAGHRYYSKYYNIASALNCTLY